MNNKTLIALFAVVALVGGAIGGYAINKFSSSLGGDFAGGVQPTNLFTANVANGTITPIGSFALVAPNGTYVGGTSVYNEQTSYVSASGTLPAAGLALGPLNSTTSTASTTLTVPNTAGLSTGAICSGGIATTTAFISGCILTSTNGATGTATVYVQNGTGAALTEVSSTRVSISFDQLPY
jgi:hypothetical protein